MCPIVKASVLILIATLTLCGCATSTIQTRQQERSAAYAELPAETQGLVDQGKIKVGMSMDAVYIAWGKPSEIVTGESAQGATTTWLYHGTQLQEVTYWGYHPWYNGYYFYGGPYLAHDYYPRTYVAAEVVFENGVVKEWRSLPQPHY